MKEMIFEKNFFIHTSFVDTSDYIRPFAIWELFQAVAGEHALNLNVGYDDLLKLNLLWVVQYEEFKVVGKLPKYSDVVKILTWPHEKKRLEFNREYELYDNDELSITGISSWFVINKDNHKLERGDNVKFNGDYYQRTNYPDFRRKKLNLSPSGDIIKSNYKIQLTDLDHNGHTNNAKYFDIIYNLGYTKIKDIKGGAISFMKECKLNDDVIIEYFKNNDNNDCYIGKINDEVSFEIILEV